MSTNRVRFSLPAQVAGGVDEKRRDFEDEDDNATIDTVKLSNVTAQGLEAAAMRAKRLNEDREVDAVEEYVQQHLDQRGQRILAQRLSQRDQRIPVQRHAGQLVENVAATQSPASGLSELTNDSNNLEYSLSSDEQVGAYNGSQDAMTTTGDDDTIHSPPELRRSEPESHNNVSEGVGDGVAQQDPPVEGPDDSSVATLLLGMDVASTASEAGVMDIGNVQHPDSATNNGDDLADPSQIGQDDEEVEHANDQQDGDGNEGAGRSALGEQEEKSEEDLGGSEQE